MVARSDWRNQAHVAAELDTSQPNVSKIARDAGLRLSQGRWVIKDANPVTSTNSKTPASPPLSVPQEDRNALTSSYNKEDTPSDLGFSDKVATCPRKRLNAKMRGNHDRMVAEGMIGCSCRKGDAR